MGKFIDPRADWAFKRIFGSDDTKECLITFLNGLFKGELIITDVKFEKNEQTKHREDERGVIFDVKCKTQDGRHIIVEMQKRVQQFFADRAIFYSAKAIVEQGVKGPWNYHLTPVYTICLMDFVSDEGIPPQFRTDLALCNLETGKQELERMRIVYLQLPLFQGKTEAECEDDIFKCWIYILRNMSDFESMPFINKHPVFRKLAAISDIRQLTPEEQVMYDEDLKIMRDLYATEQYARIREERNLKKGLEKGLEKGRAEGKSTEKLETAKRFLAMGLSPEQVAEGTLLSLEDIRKIFHQTAQSVN